MHKGRAAAIAATTLSGALLLPGVAAAQPDVIPPIPMDASNPGACSTVKATYRVTVTQARADKQAAYAVAAASWRSGIADEKRQLTRALAKADSRTEVNAAWQAYQATTVDERGARAHARRSARLTYRTTVKQAIQIFRDGWRRCH